MTHNDCVQIRIDLEGDLRKKFLEIKKVKGIENNTDVIRNLIAEALTTKEA
jgi:hypothetical protein